MSFTESEISKMTFDELRKVKLHVSKELNNFSQGSQRWVSAETLRLYVESREDALEEQFIKEAKTRGAKFHRCSSCSTDKPLEDHPYGYLLSKPTICKRCKRRHTQTHHANNPELGRERASHNQSRRQELGTLSSSDQILIRKLQKDKCAYCGDNLNGGGEFDHFIPAEQSGANTIDNRVLACTTCNRNKGRKMPAEFLRWRNTHKLPIRQGGFYEPHKQNPAVL